MKAISRREILALGFSTLAGCIALSRTKEEKIRKISYRLEDLCDAQVRERNLKINIYMAPKNNRMVIEDESIINNGDVMWDYRKYKEELFGYVRGFFRQQKVNCEFVFSEYDFNFFDKPDEVGIEILDSKEAFLDRYFRLVLFKDFEKKRKKKIALESWAKHVSTNKGIALIDGSHEEFRYLPQNEMEDFFNETYQGMKVKDFVLKSNAGDICHEILHLLGLFHTNSFRPCIIEDYVGEIPNIMANQNPKFSKEHIVGFALSELQRKLIHSFLAGNNFYKAFRDSNRDLDIFLENVAKANYRVVREQG